MSTYFRVHPAINIARVGSSKDYYIAPETAAGEIVDKKTGLFGGLPIKKGTEDTPIQEVDLRDAAQNPLRQAARFRIYAYDQPQESYPSQDLGQEINIGDVVGGKTVKDIVWTVHLANKKNNNYSITSANGEEEGIVAYKNGNTPPVRNPSFGDNLNSTDRISKLVIDAGPRALSAAQGGSASFAKGRTPCYATADGCIADVKNYPTSYPDDHFSMFNPLGVIDTLGEMEIEPKTGRLIVVGGYGLCSAIEDDQGNPPTLNDAIDNDGWFDDTSDGPVTAIIVFTDGSSQPAVHGWVVCTDPGYAPQTRNVNSVWDDAYNTWVQEVDLVPGLFANGAYNPDYKASFDADVLPVFHGAFLQRWNTNLPNQAIKGHETMASIQPGDDPTQVIPNFKQLLRDPNKPEEDGEGVKMPLALGDAMRSYLSLSPTQYFVLNQWYDGKSEIGAPPIGAGEKLDRSVLENLLGGRFSPGIDLTFIVRDTHLYNTQWQGETGPFRINMEALDYTTVSAGTPFLHEGYVPLRSALVEPGDLCKFMSQPWHTDYNSCATHTPDPNPAGNNTLYWSWPAQRPVNVYPKDKCNYVDGIWYLGGQAYSVRGDEGMFGGTRSDYPAQQGRYQCYFDFVMNWHKIGFVIQGLQVPDNNGGNYGSDKFIEVSSLYQDDGQLVMPWPTADEPPYTKEMRAKMNRECGPKKS